MLPILTGNIGLPGTNLGEEPGNYTYPVPELPMPANKVKAKIPCFLWTDAIVQDESPCEFIFVIDNHMTPSARYADVLLPDITNFEGSDIIPNGYAVGEIGGPIYLSPAIASMYECKSAWDICTLLARYLGVEENYTEGKAFEEWLQEAHGEMQRNDPDLPDLETARRIGMIKRKAPEEMRVGLAKFREDPSVNPLKTPSGKIEIYSEQLAEIAATWELPEGDVITPLPQCVATWEGFEDAETRKEFPLQLFGRHPKGRTHSTFHNVDLLRQVVSDSVWINPIDAEERGIRDGDVVRVRSKRGETRLPAKVTPRIMPGVASLEQGAWYKTDANGIDQPGLLRHGPVLLVALAVVAAVIVTLRQGALLPRTNSSIKRAADLSPHYAGWMSFRIVILFSAAGLLGVELLCSGTLPASFAVAGLVMILIAEMIGRGIHFGLYMTVGLR